ncbi:MAG: hypothetical protein MI673_10645 [Thiotrichales bacterium]|nr:hypothetical protein [Thiotrichales bacterium]
MKTLFVAFLLLVIVGVGFISTVEAHPHATLELMESHSHSPDSEKFQEEFILHDFEHVIIATWEWFNRILFG